MGPYGGGDAAAAVAASPVAGETEQLKNKKDNEDGSTLRISPSSTSTATTATVLVSPTSSSEITTSLSSSSPPQLQQHEEETGFASTTIHDYGDRSGLGVIEDTVDFGCTMPTTTTRPTAAASASMVGAPPMNHQFHNNIPEVIDNRNLTYVPIRLTCGSTVLCSPQTLASCPMILRSLQVDVTECLKVLPKSVHKLVKRTPIWVNASYQYGDKRDPHMLNHSTTHHSTIWLTQIANDVPSKARSVEIYNCFEYERMRLHWNGCGLLLHELCHIIHQHCIQDGLNNLEIDKLFQRSDQSGLYECVLRRDWAGRTITQPRRFDLGCSSRSRSSVISLPSRSSPPRRKHHGANPMTLSALERALASEEDGYEEDIEETVADSDLAYAMVDKKEFFAEMSVTFLANSYHTLDKGNCLCMDGCCPPILEPTVLGRVVHQLQLQQEQEQKEQQQKGPYGDTDDVDIDTTNCGGTEFTCWSGLFKECQKLIDWTDTGRQKQLFLPPEVDPALSSTVDATAAATDGVAVVNNNSSHHDHHTRIIRRRQQRKKTTASLMVDIPFQDTAVRQNCANVKHCNKFYPFTRGQLRFYDKELHDSMQSIWKTISSWDDPVVG
mmetsp:Transcript_24813/g.58882  ORF Transcript_24813/g.58882 Transcript_24813/m.58882 type:complete len:609 (-) Transcript_24813:116-1942(-)